MPGPLTRDAFLGGRLHLSQPATGYRAGIDPVLLAAAVPARAGQSVLELGCGVGTALLCLAVRVPGLRLVGIELQEDYAALARDNAAHHGIAADIRSADLRRLPDDLRQRQFDHVIANPPYYRRDAASAAADPGREVAFAGDTPLDLWFETAARRLAPRGRLTMIQRSPRLPEMLAACQGRIGSLELRPLQARAGRPAKLILLSGVKGGRAEFVLAPPLCLHRGARHLADGDDYAPEISAVLRDAAALPAFSAKY